MPSSSNDERRRPGTEGQISKQDFETRRERVLERLTEAFSGDEISLEDYETRAAAAQHSRSLFDLDESLAGLPVIKTSGAATRAGSQREAAKTGYSSAAPAQRRTDPSLSGSSSVACIMGERQMNGDWIHSERVEAFTVMGSTQLDLRDTTLPEGRFRIEVFTVMGETKVIVPRNLPVRMNAFPFMGEARANRDVDQRIRPGEPFVEISGFILMGSLVVVAAD